MVIDLEKHLSNHIITNKVSLDNLQLPCLEVEQDSVKAIMINECPPADPSNSLYSKSKSPADLLSILSLFHEAGVAVNDMDDIKRKGIYITNAIKSPKTEYTVSRDIMLSHLPLLEEELSLFPNIKIIMLMGDTAKKAFNLIAKKNSGKNAIPSGSTYKIRANEYYFKDIRVIPSYIMTGGNLMIEKGKRSIISEDISRMMALI